MELFDILLGLFIFNALAHILHHLIKAIS